MQAMWQTEQSEVTSASPDAVWAVLSDVEAWPGWNPGLKRASLRGKLEPGMVGEVILPDGRRRPMRFDQVQINAALNYSGSAPPGRIHFLNRIEPGAHGGSRVSMGAAISGWLAPLYGRFFGRVIAGYLPTAVAQLADRAEARQRGGADLGQTPKELAES
jgi:hypothetical protein